VLHGTEPKTLPCGATTELSALQKEIIAEIERMTDDELFFIATYIEAVKKKKALEKKRGGASAGEGNAGR
jgi:hypothetical protein